MTSRSQILLIFLLLWAACSKPRNVEFTNELNNCDRREEPQNTKSHQVGAALVRLPGDWKVQTDSGYAGLEAVDTASLYRSDLVLTFSIHEFKSQGGELLDFFRTEVGLMRLDTINTTILEKGYRAINGNKSYYVISKDKVEGMVVHQLIFYSENKDKFYAIQVGSSDIRYPTRDFCEHLWMVDAIRFD